MISATDLGAALVSGAALKRYVVSHEAWYSRAVGLTGREIVVSLAGPSGGCLAEFTITEHFLGWSPCWRLNIFDDAWVALAADPNLAETLAMLGQTGTVSEAAIRGALDALGYADATERRPV